MTLEDLSRVVPGFNSIQHVERIRLFAWFLHTYEKLEHFRAADIARCYATLGLHSPANVSQQLSDLASKRPPELLKSKSGYRLEKRVRDDLDSKYGSRPATIQVTHLLLNLPERVPDLAERTFLDEAMLCYRYGAFRAAVVMTWNLAYHHFCDHILRKHLAAFNGRWPLVFQGHHSKGARVIATIDDFGEMLKESEVIKIAKSAGIITNDVSKILEEKLGRRNSAAHPSSVKIAQLQAEDFIDDLVNNVVLKLI